MRTTLNLDDDLIADASAYSGVTDKGKLVHLALDFYIKRMAAKRLVALGGTMPDLVVPARNASRFADDNSSSRDAARALVALGGTMPDLEVPARRRPALDDSAPNTLNDGPSGHGSDQSRYDDP